MMTFIGNETLVKPLRGVLTISGLSLKRSSSTMTRIKDEGNNALNPPYAVIYTV